ncbi:hypothetical protein [Cognatilysobacter bugurensis]|uniref:Integral membrane protein n=1 Tax=Cognatilysobacter bugurensis TaxID=543356 RepID=A0A918SSJ5_9GAMM|nr:hypothetical protein [Lysobacter bugurensis]GHA69324.1 hypothetical protein GCM10007067_01570 [Lysobacter bugurensis]
MSPRIRPAALLRLAWTIAFALLLTACAAESPEDTSGARLSGLVVDPQLDEISGLAASRLHPGVLWSVDDGGNPERLFAIDARGQRIATFRVEGVPKTDWEDLASFELDGRAYLLIADVGDNGGLRRSLQLHVVEEPARLENARLKPAWSIAFRWPDGPRDCEAVGVDVARRQVLLVSKKREPPELFRLPLRAPDEGLLTARRVGTLAGVPRPVATPDRPLTRLQRMQSHVTAADVSPDGHTLAVMTYRHLLLYRRDARQSWRSAVTDAPDVRVLPVLPQAEALAWSRDGRTLYATGEFIPAPLYRIVP